MQSSQTLRQTAHTQTCAQLHAQLRATSEEFTIAAPLIFVDATRVLIYDAAGIGQTIQRSTKRNRVLFFAGYLNSNSNDPLCLF